MEESSQKVTSNYSGLVEVGPVPTSTFPRWGKWVQAPLGGLPPVKEYRCHTSPSAGIG